MDKYCIHCGKKLKNSASFCSFCGKCINSIYVAKRTTKNNYAIIGFGLSIISLVLFFLFWFIPDTVSGIEIIFLFLFAGISISSLVFSFVGYFNSKKLAESGKSLSLSAIIINILSILLFILMFFLGLCIVLIEEIFSIGIY